MKGVSDIDYENMQQIWNSIEKNILGCFHDTYLKKRCPTCGRFIWDLLKYMLWTLQVRFSAFLHSSSVSIQVPTKDCVRVLWAWKRKDCELSLDKFRSKLLRQIAELPMDFSRSERLWQGQQDLYEGQIQSYWGKNVSSIFRRQKTLWARIQKLSIFGFAWEKVNGFTPKKIDKQMKKDW